MASRSYRYKYRLYFSNATLHSLLHPTIIKPLHDLNDPKHVKLFQRRKKLIEKMMLISFLAILGFYLFAVTAGPLANGGTSDMITITNRTAVGTEYAIRCNGLGLDLNYQQQCISKFFAIGQGTITVPVNGDVHMCSEPGIKISGRALDK